MQCVGDNVALRQGVSPSTSLESEWTNRYSNYATGWTVRGRIAAGGIEFSPHRLQDPTHPPIKLEAGFFPGEKAAGECS